MSTPTPTPTIKRGSKVLVTGANGYIASHVADQLLAAGYDVRGTARSAEKAKWLYDLFDEKYGKGRFESVSVSDMTADGAFDSAVKGVSGICHIASIMTFSDRFDEVVPPTVKGALEILKSATKESGIKSLVYTSSATAALLPQSGKEIVVTEDTWNDVAIETAQSNPDIDAFTVYGASKTAAEKALWQAISRSKPLFQVSAVLPGTNFGRILQPGGALSSSTASYVVRSIQGDASVVHEIQPQWFVDVADTARLHVAALLDPDCDGKRIFAFAEPFNWNDVLVVLREQNPGREFLADFEGLGRDLSEIVPKGEAEKLLRKWFGREGFVGLAESILENSKGVI